MHLALQPTSLDEAAMPSVMEALHCLRVAITVFDADQRLIFANQHFSHIFRSLPPRDQLVGRSYEELIRLELGSGEIADPAILSDIEGFVAARKAQFLTGDYSPRDVPLADGRIIEIKARRTAEKGWIALWTDVTQARQVLSRLETAMALSKAQSAAQANYLADLAVKLDRTAASADTTKTTLLRTMSHELKTPLNAIIGFSDLLGSLADHASPAQIREYAGLIHLGGKNLLTLLNQILDLTKISAGRYELRRRAIDVAASLWEVRERFDERAYMKEITIDTAECEPGLAAAVDENAYLTMLNHLVDNAVNFTQPGGTVHLSAGRTGRMVRIVVADNGPGIASGELGRILEPFEQGGRSTSDHNGGAGLGLTLVKAFSELHGGRLTLQSELGEGFTAVLEVPSAE